MRSGVARSAFTLVELVAVVVILAVLAAVALPRVSSAVENSRFKALAATTAHLDHAVARYVAEHDGRTPAEDSSGSPVDDPDRFMARLLQATDRVGTVGVAGEFGPYLAAAPDNPFGTCDQIRTDGVPAGSNDCGWRFDSTRLVLEPDHADAQSHREHPLSED